MIQMIQSREYHILELSKHVEISDLQIKLNTKKLRPIFILQTAF